MTTRERQLEEEIRQLRRRLDAVEVRNNPGRSSNIFLCRTHDNGSYPPEASTANTVYPIVIQDGSFPRVPGLQPGVFKDHSATAKIFATALTDVWLEPNTKGIAFELAGYWWFVPECRAENPTENGDAALITLVFLRVEYSWENGRDLLIRLWDSFHYSYPSDTIVRFRVTVYQGTTDSDPILARYDGPPGVAPSMLAGQIGSTDPREARIRYYVGWPAQVLVRVEGWPGFGNMATRNQILTVPTPTATLQTFAYTDPDGHEYTDPNGEPYEFDFYA